MKCLTSKKTFCLNTIKFHLMQNYALQRFISLKYFLHKIFSEKPRYFHFSNILYNGPPHLVWRMLEKRKYRGFSEKILCKKYFSVLCKLYYNLFCWALFVYFLVNRALEPWAQTYYELLKSTNFWLFLENFSTKERKIITLSKSMVNKQSSST